MGSTSHPSCVEIILSGVPQKTLQDSVRFTGEAFHLGGFAEVVVEPAPRGYGIRLSCKEDLQASKPTFSYCDDHTTSLLLDETRVLGMEHLLSALHGLEINNAHIRLVQNLEMPLADGSSLFFVEQLLDVGIVEQSGLTRYMKIKQDVSVSEDRNRWIKVEPCEKFIIEATIDFSSTIIGKQKFSTIVTPQSYVSNIAPARTFIRDSVDKVPLAVAKETRLKGLDVINIEQGPVIIYSDKEYLSNLRFPNEPVRHKILDFIGDLYTLGMPVKGKFTLSRPGHSINHRLCYLLQRYMSEALVSMC